MTYYCMRCGNSDDFFPTPSGTCCSRCLGYEIRMGNTFEPEVYVPDTTAAQVEELFRIHNLPSERPSIQEHGVGA